MGGGRRVGLCGSPGPRPVDGTVAAGTAAQAKYMVLRVSWWICTALARACWSRPLLWPEVWLPSALWGRRQETVVRDDIPEGGGVEG